MKKLKTLILSILFSFLFFIVYSYCPLQSHPLSEICPIDVNLNMQGFNITNVGVVFAGRIVASQLCIGNDCRSSWPTIAENDPYWNLNISKIEIGYLIKRNEFGISQSIIYEKDGKIGIGTTNPKDTLEVIGNITASGIIRASKICIGEYCSDIIGNLSGSGIRNSIAYWINENVLGATPFFVTSDFNLNLSGKNIFNVSWINASYIYSSNLIFTTGKIGISVYPEYSLDIVGSVRIRAGLTTFSIENTGDTIVLI